MSWTRESITWEKEGDVTFIRFEGDRLAEPVESNQALEELSTLAVKKGGKMLLSLAKVRFISSSGIATLLTLNRLLQSRDGDLKICDVRPPVSGVFARVGLGRVLPFYESADEAMKAFKRAG